LLASWTVAYWALLLVTRWRRGAAVWVGGSRWIMARLALLGSVLLGITGTLGGHLVGIYTEVSNALRWLGWEVFTTVITLLLVALGLWGRRASASPSA
jgi:hypothetical protein